MGLQTTLDDFERGRYDGGVAEMETVADSGSGSSDDDEPATGSDAGVAEPGFRLGNATLIHFIKVLGGPQPPAVILTGISIAMQARDWKTTRVQIWWRISKAPTKTFISNI